MKVATFTVQEEQIAPAANLLRVTSPAPRPRWEAVLRSDPLALVDQTPDWLDAICASGPYEDASRLYELSDGSEIVLPLVRRRFGPFEQLFSPPPGWGIGGPLYSRPPRPGDARLVMDDLASLPALQSRLRPNPLTGGVWAQAHRSRVTVLPRTAHVLDLGGGFDHVWSHRFDSLTRRNIRKAESSGLTVECDTTGRLMPVFYQLFEQSVERWAGKQNEPTFLARWRAHRRDPLEKLVTLAQRMGQSARLWVAWTQGQPAAAILVLQGAGNAHYTRGAMNRDLAGPTRANDLLHRMAIEDACRSGCRYYHMGETGDSESLARFKTRFGAEAYPYAEYVIEKLPFTEADRWIRTTIKRLIGFKDA